MTKAKKTFRKNYWKFTTVSMKEYHEILSKNRDCEFYINSIEKISQIQHSEKITTAHLKKFCENTIFYKKNDCNSHPNSIYTP